MQKKQLQALTLEQKCALLSGATTFGTRAPVSYTHLKVHFYTEKEDFVVPGTLKNYEEKLVGRAFARCNSGYLVNLAQVSGCLLYTSSFKEGSIWCTIG